MTVGLSLRELQYCPENIPFLVSFPANLQVEGCSWQESTTGIMQP